MYNAPLINWHWEKQAEALRDADPARFHACAQAINDVHALRPVLDRFGISVETAYGIRILEGRKRHKARLRLEKS